MNVSQLEQRCYVNIEVLRGRHATECRSELVEALGDRALPYRTVARHTGTDQATVDRILRKDLNMRQTAAKWVPHELNEVQKWTGYEARRVNLERYEIEGDNFLNRMISIDET
ncbi:hypothetical protein B7P43_G07919 [Cryptotermes secundus]|uniref:Uncharacterized protein n=1 Tax=Cryptotermes secundus TaxID=105785 RepID=A0A2J7QTF7_9NEOP|nr:hypothetical protein B7P43_G07919 [Cryptotermes secundus]